MKIEDIDTAIEQRDKREAATQTLARVNEAAEHPHGHYLRVGTSRQDLGVNIDAAEMLPGTWEKIIELLRQDFAEQIANAENAIDAL